MPVLWGLAGCEKSTVSRQDNTLPKLKFVKARSASGDIVQNEYRYNDKGLIEQRISYKDYAIALAGTVSECYYQGSRLVEVNEQIDYSSMSTAAQYIKSRSTFIYSGDLIIQQNHFLFVDNQYTLTSFTVFTYNNKALPVKQTRFAADGTLVGYSLFTYNGDNVTVSEEYHQKPGISQPELAVKTSYQHDTHMNPYRDVYQNIENIPFSININNITSTTSVTYNSNPRSTGELSTSTSATYTYNRSGYPINVNENGNEFLMEYQ